MIVHSTPVYRATRWVVHDDMGAVRAFHTQKEAMDFMRSDVTLTLSHTPEVKKTITVEDAPF
jgi:hypothetical protein